MLHMFPVAHILLQMVDIVPQKCYTESKRADYYAFENIENKERHNGRQEERSGAGGTVPPDI